LALTFSYLTRLCELSKRYYDNLFELIIYFITYCDQTETDMRTHNTNSGGIFLTLLLFC